MRCICEGAGSLEQGAGSKKTKSRNALLPAPRSKLPALFADIGQQGHEASSLDRIGDGVLADGRAAALPPADDLALTVDELLQQFEILVIDVHRARTLALDEQGILLLAADLGLRAALADAIDLKLTCHEDSVTGKLVRETLFSPTLSIRGRMRETVKFIKYWQENKPGQ